MQQSIKLGEIDTSLSFLRLTRPEQIHSMEKSLEKDGQLHPVVVRKTGSVYQMIDGFKRYYASRNLKWEKLQSHIVEADNITSEIMILSYNRKSSSLVDYEEAQIVYRLRKDHLMSQEEISTRLLRSSSWINRRISFIERLSKEVQSHLRLGKINVSHARELIKLPRGTQAEFLRLIIADNLTSRQTSFLVSSYLQSKTKKEQEYVLKSPMEVIEKQGHEADVSDCRLSSHGNRLLKTLRILARGQHIFIGQSTNPPLNELHNLIICV